MASLVLDHYGFSTDLDGRPDGPVDLAIVGHDWSFGLAKEALEANEIQIAIFLTAYSTEAVKDLAGKGRFALLEVDRAEGIHRSHPFLDVTSIPTASYPTPAKFPPKETKPLAVDEVLIGSSTLSDQEAYRIVEAVFQSLVRQLELARTKDAVLAVEGEASRLFASKKIDKETYESVKEFARVRLSRLDEKD